MGEIGPRRGGGSGDDMGHLKKDVQILWLSAPQRGVGPGSTRSVTDLWLSPIVLSRWKKKVMSCYLSALLPRYPEERSLLFRGEQSQQTPSKYPWLVPRAELSMRLSTRQPPVSQRKFNEGLRAWAPLTVIQGCTLLIHHPQIKANKIFMIHCRYLFSPW